MGRTTEDTVSKKHFIALADAIREHNAFGTTFNRANPKGFVPFHDSQIRTLADFCQSQNSNFKRDRWLAYIAGECGPNGGPVR